ncbi:MAG TPA: nuclear transport factor 2 family protein [Candidatus Angelobacter sp.]
MPKRNISLILLAATALLSVSQIGRAQSQPLLPADVIAANQELDRRLLEAHAQKDTNAVLRLFSIHADVFFITPNGTINKGLESMRHSFDRFFSSLEGISAEIKEVSYLPAGDCVIGVGTVVFHRHLKSGQTDERTVVWTDLRRKENGKWLFVFRHAHWPVASDAR